MTTSRETRGTARLRLAAAFRLAGLDSPDLDARLLVCAAAGIGHADLVRDPDEPLGLAAAALDELAARRLRREPVARILGRREFWGLPFAISRAVLDPRPETEGLVGSVLDAAGARRAERLAILDLGVGSGAILAALLSELPNAEGVGVDRSFEACRIARSNLSTLGVGARARLVCGDWTSAIGGRFDIVVSNPPYIETAELAGLSQEVRDHDPVAALDGGTDGLDAYRAIVRSLGSVLAPDAIIAFECGAGQGARIAALIRPAGFADPAVYLDLAGHDRVVLGVASGTVQKCATPAPMPK